MIPNPPASTTRASFVMRDSFGCMGDDFRTHDYTPGDSRVLQKRKRELSSDMLAAISMSKAGDEAGLHQVPRALLMAVDHFKVLG